MSGSGPARGAGGPAKGRGPVAGFFATLAVDFLVWLVFLIVAFSGSSSMLGFSAAGMTVGYLIAGVVLYYYGRGQGYGGFKKGVVIATSVVFLLDVACWGSLGIGLRIR